MDIERDSEEENLKSFGVYDIATLIEVSERLDTAKIKTIGMTDALVKIGHIFRI